MTSPIGISWGCDDLDLEGGYGPLVLDDYPNPLTTAEESLCNAFGIPDQLPPGYIQDGTVSRATYRELYEAIGDTFGSFGHDKPFVLPDMDGRAFEPLDGKGPPAVLGLYLDGRPIDVLPDGTFRFLDEAGDASDDVLPARIHAARDDDGSIDIFGKDSPSLWQRIKAWWGSLTGPVPGDGGASVSGAYSPWGWM